MPKILARRVNREKHDRLEYQIDISSQGENGWLPVWRLLPKHILDFERKQVKSDLPPISSPRVEEVRKFREAERAKRLKLLEEKKAKEKKERDEEEEEEQDDENNDESTEEEEWEVEKILDIRLDDDGDKEYLVHWKEYPESDATWEPMENLEGATQEIENFHLKNPKKRAKKVKKVDKVQKFIEEQLLENKEEDIPERDPSPDFLDALDAEDAKNSDDSSDDDFEPGVKPMKKKRKKENSIPSESPVIKSPEEVSAQRLSSPFAVPQIPTPARVLPRILGRTPKSPLQKIQNVQLCLLNGAPVTILVEPIGGISITRLSETHCVFHIDDKKINFFDRRSKWTSFNPRPIAAQNRRAMIALKFPHWLKNKFDDLCNQPNAEASFKFLLNTIKSGPNLDKCFNAKEINVYINLPPVIPCEPIDLTNDDDGAEKIQGIIGCSSQLTGLEVKSAFDPVSKKRKHILTQPEVLQPLTNESAAQVIKLKEQLKKPQSIDDSSTTPEDKIPSKSATANSDLQEKAHVQPNTSESSKEVGKPVESEDEVSSPAKKRFFTESQQNPIIEEPKSPEKPPKVKVESPEGSTEKTSLMPKRTARNKKLLTPSKAEKVPVMTVRPNQKITEAPPRHAILEKYRGEINMDDIVKNGFHCHYKFCSYRFSGIASSEEVESHYHEYHGFACSNMSRRTTCHDCQIPFNTLKELSDHEMHYHQKAAVITQKCGFARSVLRCKFCIREFKSPEEHLHHQYNDHVPDVKCDHCPFIARSVQQLQDHFILHYGVKERMCRICSVTCKSKTDLNEHLKNHLTGTIPDIQSLARDLQLTESVPSSSMGAVL